MTMSKRNETTINISYKLTGDQAALFLEAKARRFLENNAELARSLMLEKLHEDAAKIEASDKRFKNLSPLVLAQHQD